MSDTRYQVYLVPHSHLKYRSIRLRPFSCLPCMFVPKLEQIAKDRHTWDFGKALDLWYVRAIEIPYNEEYNSNNCYTHALITHGGLSTGYESKNEWRMTVLDDSRGRLC